MTAMWHFYDYRVPGSDEGDEMLAQAVYKTDALDCELREWMEANISPWNMWRTINRHSDTGSVIDEVLGEFLTYAEDMGWTPVEGEDWYVGGRLIAEWYDDDPEGVMA